MPLNFHPASGAIVICDFSTGFQPPEMVKVRPVVVISPRRRTGQLATVVPLSSTPPAVFESWHYAIPAGAYPPARGPMWAKCDVVATVALARLDRIKTRDRAGNRVYQIFQLGPVEMAALQAAVKAGLGLP
jgi:uncharacterized protein YifN (PemK superfamily)